MNGFKEDKEKETIFGLYIQENHAPKVAHEETKEEG